MSTITDDIIDQLRSIIQKQDDLAKQMDELACSVSVQSMSAAKRVYDREERKAHRRRLVEECLENRNACVHVCCTRCLADAMEDLSDQQIRILCAEAIENSDGRSIDQDEFLSAIRGSNSRLWHKDYEKMSATK